VSARAEGVAAGFAGALGGRALGSSRATRQDLAEALLDLLGRRAQEPADRLRPRSVTDRTGSGM